MQHPDAMPLPDFAVADPASTQGVVVRGLTRSFGERKVLDGLDFHFRRGETVVILGRSGEGKSVLLKHIVRLLEPDAGQVWVDGEEITGLHKRGLFEVRKRFGMLFQGAALFDSMTICENVALGLVEHSKESKEWIRARACECLAMVGLQAAENKLPSELSGGMKKRAGLARAIAMSPDYILYDEPTTGLDPITSDAINDLILKLQAELNVTSIVVTHDMASAFKVADRIAMLSKGRMIYADTVDAVRETEHPVIRQFIQGSAHGPLSVF
ncbi:MAG TPA: ABC transporter ATP-binding protein [Candidatus Krumholzibacteria bacterium]|nr:ABC transporter ATP-binding protein [Candidatus Krumholzibacteria bacterium]HRX50813.1 ABC transporter ATP-binding protein [Candidatus Krumholzibacteria bacterium]